MSSHRVVVDGSNIATEGRSLPSLQQLDEAVRAYRDEHPDVEIIVVVDATFAHRIDESERQLFEEAAAHNELVYPPAGAIGRGDAFLLRIADKTDAVVLSNDSFQEFHGEFEWLFTKGRLIGGTPVPGVGWIFVPRTPVRGPKSREAVKEAKRGKARIGSKEASAPMPVPKAPPPRSPKNKDAKGGDSSKPPKGGGRLKAAIEEATEEAGAVDEAVGAGGGSGKRKRRRGRKGKGGGGGGGDAGSSTTSNLPTVNEPLTFIQFIADHQPGASVDGEIESFASHGAFVLVGDARCYIPLSAMGDPPPRSAREVLNRGEVRTFVVQALDAPRRGIELALPGFERVAGQPTDETVEAEIGEAPPPIASSSSKRGGRGGRGRKAAVSPDRPVGEPIPIVPEAPQELPLALPVASGRRKAAAKKAPATKAPAKKAASVTAAKKAATTGVAKKSGSGTAAKKAGAGTAAKKAPAKATKATAATKAPAKATKAPATKATAKKAPSTKAPAKATKAPAKATKAPAKATKATATKTPAKKTPAKAAKTSATKTPTKSPAKKATAKKAPAKKAKKSS
jgi:hypothetical protein